MNYSARFEHIRINQVYLGKFLRFKRWFKYSQILVYHIENESIVGRIIRKSKVCRYYCFIQ